MNKLLLVCLFVLMPVTMASADLKIAVIDLEKAFDSYHKTKDANARIQEKVEAAKKDMSDLATQYEHMQEEAQKLHDASVDPTLSQQARADKAAALQQKEQDLLALQQKMQQTKQEREGEIQEDLMLNHKEILEEITKVVSDYSGPQGYDVVFDKSGLSAASGLPVILYNSNKLVDITDEVIHQLNANAPPASATAPSGAAPSGAAPASSTTMPPAP